MRKSDRLFQLTNILRAHQPITAKEISDKLNVSERTVYRYIDDLSVSGVPIYGQAGLGYRLSEGYELPPLQLTHEELEALIVGVNMVLSWTGSDFGKISQSLLSKIEAILPSSFNQQSSERKYIRTPGSHVRSVDYLYWDRINEAIGSKQRIKINYTSLKNKHSTRIVLPLGLFYWGSKWTLGCWCSLKSGYRDFRLDCIQKVTLETSHFELPHDVSFSRYITYQKEQSLKYATDTMLSGEVIDNVFSNNKGENNDIST